jgi:hypothetical protein
MRLILFAAIIIAAVSSLYAQQGTWVQETTSAWSGGRWAHTAVIHDNRMWVIGGETSAAVSSQVLYSSNGVNWTQASTGQFPGRWGHASVTFNNRIWVMGGYGALNLTSSRNDVWSSADGVNWTQETSSAGWSIRGSLAAVVFNNRVWIMGGQHGSTNFNDVWSSADGVNWTQENNAAAWSARGSHAVEVFNNRIWVLGGLHSSTSTNHDDVWSSGDGVNWTQESANPGWTSRRGHHSANFSNRLWVMGGGGAGTPAVTRNGIQLGAFNNDYWSSTDGANWSQESPPAGWLQRRGHRVLVFNGKLWLIGGLGTGVFGGLLMNDVWSYEPVPLTTTIAVRKFYDTDLDGLPGPASSEPGIEDWPFELRLALDDSLVDAGVTDADGELEFVVALDNTEYKIVEIPQDPYINITPLVQMAVADQARVEVQFGNVALECLTGLGRTRGYWGASPQSSFAYTAGFPGWAQRLNALHLVDNGGDVLVLSTINGASAMAAMRAWFRAVGPSNNRAHQLSVQLAASALSVHAGFMSGHPGVFVTWQDELRNIEEVFDMAADLLEENPVVLRGGAIAQQMARFKDFFEAINENREDVCLVLPGPVPPMAVSSFSLAAEFTTGDTAGWFGCSSGRRGTPWLMGVALLLCGAALRIRRRRLTA